MIGPRVYSSDNPFIEQKKDMSGYSPDNPFLVKPTIDHPIEQESIGGTLANYSKYIWNLATDPGDLHKDPVDVASKFKTNVINTGKALGTNLETFGTDIYSILGGHGGDQAKATLNKYIDPIRKGGVGNPLSFHNTIISLASLPIQVASTLTNTTAGPNGEVIPATPEQEAKNVQGMIGMVASGAVASKIVGAMMPEANALLGMKNVSYPGLMLRSTYPKIISGLAAGATYGGIEGIGQEDQLASTIGSSLAFATLGALWRPFKAASELGNNIDKAREKVRSETRLSASQLAATRGLQITSQDSPVDIAAKTKAFSESSDAIQAWVGSNLEIGKQVILDGIPQDEITRITSKYMPSPRASEGVYRPSSETSDIINRTQFQAGKPNQIVQLTDPFDKAIMISEKNQGVLQEIKDNTGLTDDEIKSHRWYLKEQIKNVSKDPSSFKPLGPNEIEAKNQEFIDKGKSLVDVPEGTTITDANNGKWLRVGNQVTNGTQSLDVNSLQTHKLLGTDAKFNPNAQYLRLGKQDFNPEYGRDIRSVNVYPGANNTTLISSYPLAKTIEAFFSQNGFLPGEMVSVNGKPHSVSGDIGTNGNIMLTDLSNGRNRQASLDMIQRIPKGLDSEFYKASNGEQLARIGVYNTKNYYDDLYTKFRSKLFNLDEEPQEAYNTTIQKFAQEVGMKNMDDVNAMASSFVSRMLDEVNDGMDQKSKNSYDRSIKAIGDWNKEIQENTSKNLSMALSNNNMSLTSRGGGIYDIKDAVSGQVLQSVKSLQEALDFTKKSGQAKAYDLDGGFTQGTPIIGGSLSDSYIPSGTSWLARWLDNKVNVAASPYLARQRSAINEMDRQSGYNFRPHFQALQNAQNIISNLTNSPAMKVMVDKVNQAIKSGGDVPLEDKAKIQDWLTSYEPKDLIKKFGLGEVDQKTALGITKVGTNDVIDFMNKVREDSNYGKIGSDQFTKAMKENSKLTDPNIVNVATNLFRQADGTAKLSGILKLAQVIEHGRMDDPTPTLSRQGKDYMTKLEAAHNSLTDVDDPFFSYGPHSKLAEITGYNPFSGHSEGFQRTYNKLISTPSNQLEMDPSNVIHNMRSTAITSAKVINENLAYFNGSNKMLSFDDVVDRTANYINSLHPKASDSPEILQNKKQNYVVTQYYQQHLDDVRGIPDLSKQLANAAEESIKQMYGPDEYKKSPDLIRLASSLVYSSLLGLRSAFTLRDLSNAHQNVYIFSGADMARKVFGGIWSRETAQKLMDDGKIPATKGLDLLNPGESVIGGMSRLSKFADVADKLSDWSTKWNGQQLGHVQMSTGIYMAYFEKVADLSEKMIKNDKSKAEAYDELGIQKIHPTEQKMFDDLISAGKTDQAGDFLARNMVDRFNTVYGRNNAPQAWRSQFGKLAGGFGQWAVGQINTNIDHFTRGTRRQIAESLIRAGVSNTAIMIAGALTGINLSRWTVMPYSLPGISPLMSGLMGVPQDMENASNLDPAIANPAVSKLQKMLPYPGNWAHLYIPGSYWLQGESDAWDMMQGDFGPAAIAKGTLGVSTINSTISPLQKAMDLQPEWKGKRVPDKGIGAGVFSNLTQKPE